MESNNKLLILGAGGHGKVIAESARLINRWHDICFLDDEAILDYPYRIIGALDSLAQWKTVFQQVVVAVGNNLRRAELLEQCKRLGFSLPTIIHPRAYLSSSATIGCASVIFAEAVINAYAKIAEGCIVNSAAIVEHDCIVDNCAHISPRAALAGGVKIGEYSWVGIGSTVIEGVVVGKNVIVGAGAVVIHDVQDNCTVVGVPARVIK